MIALDFILPQAAMILLACLLDWWIVVSHELVCSCEMRHILPVLL